MTPNPEKKEQSTKYRKFYVANRDFNTLHNYPNNYIKTSKYTKWNFLPKNLWLQFHKMANVYFLVIAIIQSIPLVSPLNPFSAVAPFIFVVFLSVIREGVEDLARHKQDEEANSSKCLILENGKFEQEQWKNIRVGDILLVKDQEFLPADLLVFSASNSNGVCYIETSSLDGEKNLKPKGAPKKTTHFYDEEQKKVRCEGSIECMLPNAQLYQFEGTYSLPGTDKIALTPKQLLLRGSKLRNTEWAIGVVVYTGVDTKIMKNAESSKNKRSKIDVQTDVALFYILMFQTVCCLAMVCGNFYFNYLTFDDHQDYLFTDFEPGFQAFVAFWSYFLLFNTMIPISLVVTIEIVKVVQALFIEQDTDLYNHEKKKGITVFTSAINEELGQVQYIFSDKTGTLTCNRMEFKIALIGKEVYGDKAAISNKIKKERSEKKYQRKPTYVDQNSGVEFSFEDEQLKNLLENGEGDKKIQLNMYDINGEEKNNEITSQKDLVVEYFTSLAVCHECVIEKNGETITYQGPSPDEITLVDASARIGFRYLGGAEYLKKVDILGTEQEFEVLQVFEFNSDRKRMSVITRDQNGHIRMYIKGADSMIQSRLDPDREQPFLNYTLKALGLFSKKGLRTLLVAMRVISQSEWKSIKRRLHEIAKMVEKEKALAQLAEDLEKNLYLLGCTAVEDQLQENVPETIHDLINADVRVWMLTGDKLETAVNIAKSCNLIQPSFHILQISEEDPIELQTVLAEHKHRFDYYAQHGLKKAIVIEGQSLQLILDNKLLKQIFMQMAPGIDACVCCRSTPKQKAEVVRLIKRSQKSITLAIGDGANDVNMIQEAHIGVGIYGNEGMRAVQASDFAIPEFQGLWRLLFIHGRWSYIRISEMILYFFYKNMVFTFPHLIFATLSGFSAQPVFDDFYITFYNMIFTALPLAVRAVFEQDINYKEKVYENKKVVDVVERPYIKQFFYKLYYVGQKNTRFSLFKFFLSVLLGLVHSVIIFYICWLAIGDQMLDENGISSDFWIFSITFYTCVIFAVDLKLALYTRYWTKLYIFTLFVLSIGLYVIYMWATDDLFPEFLIYKSVARAYQSPYFYLCIILTLGFITMGDMFYKYYKLRYHTTLIDYFQILVKRGKHNDPKAFEEAGLKIVEDSSEDDGGESPGRQLLFSKSQSKAQSKTQTSVNKIDVTNSNKNKLVSQEEKFNFEEQALRAMGKSNDDNGEIEIDTLSKL